MIKIAFVIDTIESPTAGTEKQLLLLIESLDRSKFEPYLCVLRNSNWLESEFNKCELVDINFKSFKSLSSYLQIIEFVSWLRKNKIDIVQTHFIDGNKVGTLAAVLAGTRERISTRRNQGYWHNRSELYILKGLNRFTNKFLCNSESTKSWLISAEKVLPHKVSVIHNAIDLKVFYRGESVQRKKFRSDLGFPEHSIIVGIVANLRPVKALDVFIRAAKNTVNALPDTRFIIVGEGTERERLVNLCKKLKIDDVVHFWGSTEKVEDILSCIDIGVLTSSSESFSNAIVEYMASQLAVVASDVGGVREAITDGHNGYIFKPSDVDSLSLGLIRLIKENLIEKFGLNGYQFVLNNYSKNVIIDKYQKFYEDTL